MRDWRSRNKYLAARFDTVRALKVVLGRWPTPDEVDSYLFWI